MKYHYILHDATRPDKDRKGPFYIENTDTHQCVATLTNYQIALNLLDIFNERGFEIETAVRVEAA